MTSLENVIISNHLSNIYAEGELEKLWTCSKMEQV